MKEIKKGIDQKKDNTQTQTQYTKVEKICLFLFAISLIFIIGGCYDQNNLITILGMGIGLSGATVQVSINCEEEDEYEE